MILKSKLAIAIFVTLALILLAIALAMSPSINNTGKIRELNDDEKTKIVEIALNDSIVKDKISDVQFKYFGQQGWTFDPNNPRFFTIGNVTIGKVHEVSPGVDSIEYLPCVELIMGHQNLGDINIYIYVDLEKDRVVYIGYTNRSGPHANGYFYTTGDDGIVQHTEDTNNTWNYNNITIVDTGYIEGQALNESEKSNLFGIARSNKTVTSFLNMIAYKGDSYNLNFQIQSDETEIYGHHFITVYPSIGILPQKPDGSSDLQTLLVIIDGTNKKIVSAEESDIFIPPPDPMPPIS